ncbi:MAG: hypothetical protein GYB68_04625 [Chloroflexi bacterium]|nr:hypothetical protein [Chloroflexota bacterium]
MSGFLIIPFWRTGTDQTGAIQYRTQLYLTPLSQGPVDLAIYLYENGGKPWSNRTFVFEIDQSVAEVTTNPDGAFVIKVGPGQTLRIEINQNEQEYGTGEVHFVGGAEAQIPLLARGDLEFFGAEAGGGFELSTSEITITGAEPTILQREG